EVTRPKRKHPIARTTRYGCRSSTLAHRHLPLGRMGRGRPSSLHLCGATSCASECTDGYHHRQDVYYLHQKAARCRRPACDQDPTQKVWVGPHGLTRGGRHYVAIFAVFDDGNRVLGDGDNEYLHDLDCSSRRFLPLVFSPSDEEEDLGGPKPV
ncbi:hypothetical protein JG688_00015919, partial [Phytophthora aleatoria]